MTQEQQQVKEWMIKFSQTCPEKPTIPSLEIRKLRAKLHLEEALELIIALGITDIVDSYGCVYDLEELLEYINGDVEFVSNKEPSLVAIADGCVDSRVVENGTLVACGLVNKKYVEDLDVNKNLTRGYDPLFNEVMRSNNSKMWTTEEVATPDSYPNDYEAEHLGGNPTAVKERQYVMKDKAGKIIKSPSYSPANLEPIIKALTDS